MVTLSLAHLFVATSHAVLSEYRFTKEPGTGIKIKAGLFQIKVLQAKVIF